MFFFPSRRVQTLGNWSSFPALIPSCLSSRRGCSCKGPKRRGIATSPARCRSFPPWLAAARVVCLPPPPAPLSTASVFSFAEKGKGKGKGKGEGNRKGKRTGKGMGKGVGKGRGRKQGQGQGDGKVNGTRRRNRRNGAEVDAMNERKSHPRKEDGRTLDYVLVRPHGITRSSGRCKRTHRAARSHETAPFFSREPSPRPLPPPPPLPRGMPPIQASVRGKDRIANARSRSNISAHLGVESVRPMRTLCLSRSDGTGRMVDGRWAFARQYNTTPVTIVFIIIIDSDDDDGDGGKHNNNNENNNNDINIHGTNNEPYWDSRGQNKRNKGRLQSLPP